MTAEEESVQVDAYLDALLAGRYARPRSLDAETPIDPELEATASVVQRALARFHPSFAFEERLAARLAAIGAGRAEPQPVERSEPVALPEPFELPQPVVLRNRDIPRLVEERRARSGLLRSGAIASGVSIAGVSIAGAALLVRRRTRLGTHHAAEASL